VISTPKSKVTERIGRVKKPRRADERQTRNKLSLLNANKSPIMAIKLNKQTKLIAYLYFLDISTQIPNAALPKIPPMMNKAPIVDESLTPKLKFVDISPTMVPIVFVTP
jgi:hypothetical protein